MKDQTNMQIVIKLWLVCLPIALMGCSDADFGGSEAVQKKAFDKAESLEKDESSKEPSEDATPEDSADESEEDEGIDLEESEAEEPVSVTADELLDLLSGDPNAESLAACLKAWGNETGLTAEAVENYRTLTTNATGFSSSSIDDRTATDKPSLVLISSEAVGFSTVEMNLGNPNGYYCLQGANVGFSGRKIQKHCKATIGSDSTENTGFSNSSISEYGSDCD